MRKVNRKRNSGDVIRGGKANFNRRHTRMKLGDHLVQCDVTGQVCFRSEASLTWRGTLVSNQNWDPRHPQLDIYISGDEDISVKDARTFQGEDEAQSSDITDNGNAVISDADIDVGASGFITFTNNGNLNLNGSLVLNEWWDQGETDGIGNFYQIRITRSTQSGALDSITGLTSAFNSLVNDVNVTVSFSGIGEVTFYCEIKSIITDEITATGSIILRRT